MHRMFYIYEAHKGQPMDQWVLMKAYVRPSHVSRWLKEGAADGQCGWRCAMAIRMRLLGLYEAEEWLRMGEAIERRNMMLDNKRRYEGRQADEPKA